MKLLKGEGGRSKRYSQFAKKAHHNRLPQTRDEPQNAYAASRPGSPECEGLAAPPGRDVRLFAYFCRAPGSGRCLLRFFWLRAFLSWGAHPMTIDSRMLALSCGLAGISVHHGSASLLRWFCAACVQFPPSARDGIRMAQSRKPAVAPSAVQAPRQDADVWRGCR